MVNTIGALSKANRKKHRLSQFEVEERTSISRFRLSQIENGRGGPPTIMEAAQLADLYLDVRIIKSMCSSCQIHQTLFSITDRELSDVYQSSDLPSFARLFVTSIHESCGRIIDTTAFMDNKAGQREQSLLVVEETKRIRFLADALELLAEQVG